MILKSARMARSNVSMAYAPGGLVVEVALEYLPDMPTTRPM
jgi:hypothetical protein